MSLPMIDLTGQRFYAWTVLCRAPSRGTSTMWWCQCDCGFVRECESQQLRAGRTTTCRACHDARVTVPAEDRQCRWCNRPTDAFSRSCVRVCPACERKGARNGRDSDGRPISKGRGNRRVIGVTA